MLDSRNSDRGRHVRSWGDVPNVAAYDINKWNISDMWKMSLQISPYVYAGTYIKKSELSNMKLPMQIYPPMNPKLEKVQMNSLRRLFFNSSGISKLFSSGCATYRSAIFIPTHMRQRKYHGTYRVWNEITSISIYDKNISNISKTPPEFKLPHNMIILSHPFYDVPKWTN